MQCTKALILWLSLALACFLPASALTLTAPENRVWEILSIGYDAPTAEVTAVGNRAETSTGNYDTAPIRRAATETRSTVVERPLFGPNAEFKAAEEATAGKGLVYCFPKGTKVETPSGKKNIEDIKVGDKVMSFNLETKKVVERPVTQLIRKATQHWYQQTGRR